jgi:hypothetical protein
MVVGLGDVVESRSLGRPHLSRPHVPDVPAPTAEEIRRAEA